MVRSSPVRCSGPLARASRYIGDALPVKRPDPGVPSSYTSDVPIYEYRCSTCGTQFERLQNVAGAVQPGCPQCGSDHVAKLISMIGGPGSSPGAPRSSGGGCGCGGACACGR